MTTNFLQLTEQLDDINKKNQTVSMALAAVKDNQILYTYNYGYSNLETKTKSKEDTVYRIASLSKFVSTIVTMTLVDQEKLSLDEDISNYLGYRVRNPYYPDLKITLRHLMTHTSTISEEGNYSLIGSGELPPYKLSQILPEGEKGYTEKNFINAKPGEKFLYSSFGTGIIGAIVEKITGIKFSEYADNVLFKPLNINASYDQRNFNEKVDIAKSYEVGEEDDFAIKLKADDPTWLKKSLDNKMKLADLPIGEAYRLPQGNLYISARGLAKIVQILLNDGWVDNKEIISADAVNEMMKIYFRDEHIKSALNLRGWDDLVEGKFMIGHYGRAYGVYTLFALDPVEKTAVISLTNGTLPIIDNKDRNEACKKAIQTTYKKLF